LRISSRISLKFIFYKKLVNPSSPARLRPDMHAVPQEWDVKYPPTVIFSMREFHTHQPPHFLLY
jgi:hypothetical protein